MSPFEPPSAYGSCTFKPAVSDASLWPIGCPEVAVNDLSLVVAKGQIRNLKLTFN
jgi:hypothetical protein